MLLTAATWACRPTPASIEFGDAEPIVLDVPRPRPLPRTIVKDEKGAVIAPRPKVSFACEPPGVVLIDEHSITALGNGTAEITATIEGTQISDSKKVVVRMVDRIDLTCLPEHCSVRIGEEIHLVPAMMSDGKPVEGVDASWTSSAPEIAEVDAAGAVRGRAPGQAEISVGAGATKSSKTVYVSAPVDQLSVRCPPERLHELKDEHRMVCMVPHAGSTNLVVDATGQGIRVRHPSVKWSSADESVASVQSADGEVFGHAEGRTIIRATADSGSASLEVVVIGKEPKCTAAPKKLRVRARVGSRVRAVNAYCRIEEPNACLARHKRGWALDDNALRECCCTLSR